MKRILIANRGEIACRIIKSCRKLGLETVAVYSDADRNSLHVALADQAHHIGASKPAESYLNVERILETAKSASAHGVHPGYGFLAENENFASAVIKAGLTWIGPSPQSIIDMGDKGRARELARAAGVPVLPGSRPFATGLLDGIEAAGAEVGFPLLVKAAAGGGGIGMQRVSEPDQLRKTADSTQSMAQRSFGDGSVYLERFVPRARHIEIQVFGFGNGEAIHLWERECSIQRRFQKIIEESPAPNLPAATREAMAQAAVGLTKNQHYSGAGTVEFVVDADTNEFYFLEMNTRIQVEHPVTEMITGVDLVAMQLQLAAGHDLSHLQQHAIRAEGHAIECRLYAENPDRMFLPSPGTLTKLSFPAEDEHVRIDTGVREGDKVTPYYDPMIAKIICRGIDRGAAIERMLSMLAAIQLEGLASNLAFLGRVVNHPAFRSGNTFTGFIEKYKADLLSSI
jgi:3-methylcrotonyl-CoA carboxylase alpha subunit